MCVCVLVHSRCTMRCVCVCVCERAVLPLPGQERGLLTSSWSGLVAEQDLIQSFIRLKIADPQMEGKRMLENCRQGKLSVS